MNKNTKMAYSEVYEILNQLEKKALLKIPQKLIKYFEEERETEYKPKIDCEKPLEKQSLKRKTIILLAMLNFYYWCENEEEKNEFLTGLKRNDEALHREYNLDNMFQNEQKQKQEYLVTKELSIVEHQKLNFMQKLFANIQIFFQRKDSRW